MLKTIMLIVNMFSGRGVSHGVLGGIVAKLSDAGFAVTVYTLSGRTTQELTAKYASNYDMVVCVGGDGTLSSVAAGLTVLPNPPPLGYIPTGTANDVAHTLGISRNVFSAVSDIINGTPKPFDMGQFGDDYFIYIAAFGAFTDVSYQTPQSSKRTLGHFAYILGGISAVASINTYIARVECDDGIIEDEFVFGAVTNSTSIAGLVRLDDTLVDLSDGLFEVVLVRRPLSFTEFGNIFAEIRKKSFQSDNILLLHTKHVRFTFDTEVAWTRDGENGGVHKSIDILNHHAALQIIMNK